MYIAINILLYHYYMCICGSKTNSRAIDGYYIFKTARNEKSVLQFLHDIMFVCLRPTENTSTKKQSIDLIFKANRIRISSSQDRRFQKNN